MVTVGGHLIRQMDALAPKAQTLLALIDGAERWLSWAMPAGVPGFQFPDELALASGVQQGVHADALMLLSRLGVLVHPAKLWALDEQHLNQVLAYEEDDGENEVLRSSLKQVLNEHGILTQDDFEAGTQLLRQLGYAGSPVFQSLRLRDQSALADLVKHPPSPLALDREAQQQAAAFAVELAKTPREFCDLYAFFFEVARARPGELAGIAAAARRARDRLAGPVQALLSCPVIRPAPSAIELYALFDRWVDQQQLVGFSNVASALRQTAARGLWLDAPGESMDARVRTFMITVQQFLKSTEPSRRMLSQDGSIFTYILEGKSASARVEWNQVGCVTLASYQPASE